ncbi:hypothetical protein TNCV_5000841 [Trichonephila clavipes]|nr:hypothetical protein TNCV_5000841 [Trichonephila clavipes]
MNRCPDLVVCLKRDLQCLRPEASLVLIYRPNVAGMKARVDLAQPINRTPDLWRGSTIHYHSILFEFSEKELSESEVDSMEQYNDSFDTTDKCESSGKESEDENILNRTKKRTSESEVEQCSANFLALRTGQQRGAAFFILFGAAKGCVSPVVKVSDHGRHVTISSPVPQKTRRVGQRCTLNLSELKRPSGEVVRRGGASTGVVPVT